VILRYLGDGDTDRSEILQDGKYGSRKLLPTYGALFAKSHTMVTIPMDQVFAANILSLVTIIFTRNAQCNRFAL